MILEIVQEDGKSIFVRLSEIVAIVVSDPDTKSGYILLNGPHVINVNSEVALALAKRWQG